VLFVGLAPLAVQFLEMLLVLAVVPLIALFFVFLVREAPRSLLRLIVLLVLIPVSPALLSMCFSMTTLALSPQAVCTSFRDIEILARGWERVSTFGALFSRGVRGYTVHTDETNPFIRHAPGALQCSQGYRVFGASIDENEYSRRE